MDRRKVLTIAVVGVVAAFLAISSTVPAAGQAGPPAAATQPVKVMNTAAEPVLGRSVDVNQVIIDEFKDIDPEYDGGSFDFNFGRHDLSAYDEITIYWVGDCVYEPPYKCGDKPGRPILFVKQRMGHPNTIHDADHPNWSLWRPVYINHVQKGEVGVETLENSFHGEVEFVVHYSAGPVHLKVIGRRN